MSLLLLGAALQLSQAEPLRAPPIDQCSGDPTFVEFREKLVGAIALKDAKSLRPLVDLEIKYSLGPEGDDGWSGFVRSWNLDRPAGSELWQELSEVLNLGCGDYNGVKFMPANLTNFGELDASFPPYWAVENGAAFRSQPDDTAPVVMMLDNHLLFELDGGAPDGWLYGRLSYGQSGYVRLSSVRSAMDYRATFELRDGQWVMTSFLAGD